MSYVTVLWSMVAAFALVLALMHSFIWVLDRRAFANLGFASIAFAGIFMAFVELRMMHAQSVEEWTLWVRWFQVPNFAYIVGTMVFVKVYFGTGRPWLLWGIISLRLGILLANFMVDPNFNFQTVESIGQISFFGEQITVVDQAVTARRQVIATVATLLALAFFIDASVLRWRQGTRDARRQALVIGGSIVFFFAFAVLNSQLVVWGIVKLPTLIAPPFLVALTAMTFEMSRDTIRASQLSRELHESARSLQLAASAAGLGLWSWDAQGARMWVTDRARAMFGLGPESTFHPAEVEQLIHGDDIARVHEAVNAVLKGPGEHVVQFRICLRKQPPRWIAARGQSVFDARGKLALIQGVLRDITEERRMQQETEELHRALNHAGRVTIVGQLASALTHELSQPLGANVLNVSAMESLLQRPKPDMRELREIVVDMQRDSQRAAEVMEKMRAMVKLRPMDFKPVAVDKLVNDVVAFVRNDAVSRGVRLDVQVDAELPLISGDKVHLSQVLINLIINAMDAMTNTPPRERAIVVRAQAYSDQQIEITVADHGTGLPANVVEKLFAPFYTTKATGMGMGLSISHTIAEAHQGQLWASNNPEGGATFHLRLPVLTHADSLPA